MYQDISAGSENTRLGQVPLLVPQDAATRCTSQPLPRVRSLKAHYDRILVAAVLVAMWHGLSVVVGPLYISTPVETLTRLRVGLQQGDLLYHAGYTLGVAMVG